MEIRLAQSLDDPFLSAVRRRHPDADLVVLPPGRPPDPPPSRPADHEALATAALQVGGRADALWTALGEPVPADVRWVHGPGTESVVARSRLVRHSQGREALEDVAAALAEGGEVRRPGGVVERLVGESSGTTTTASWAPAGVLVVEVRSAALVVGAALVRDLTRQADPDGTGS